MSTFPHTNEGRPGGSSLPSDWREVLSSRIEGIRVAAVRLLWLRAVGMLLIGGVLGIVLLVALDWWLRPSQPFGRWAMTSLLLLWLCGLAAWFASGTRDRRLSPAVIARQLERLIPSLGDRLSSAVAILASDSAAAEGAMTGEQGGASRGLAAGALDGDELAARAVWQATAELHAARPEQTLDRGPALRTAFTGVALLAGLVAACLWQPATASLAARRLVAPSSDAAWPRRTHLELTNVPERMHAGTDLEVFVRDRRGSLPDDTEIVVRDSEGTYLSPPLRMSGEAAAARIEGVTDDFAIRARGGDDDTMPWRNVSVVAPPTIRDYQVRLLPPEYSGAEPQTLVGDRLRVLSGTRMWIEATVAPGVVEAVMERIDGGQARVADADAGEPSQWPVDIEADGHKLGVGPIELRRDGEFAFRWTDASGIESWSRQRWRIEVTEDVAPRVTMNQPTGDVQVTREGTLRWEIVAEDDLGLSETWLEARGGGLSEPYRFAIAEHPETPRDQTRRQQVSVDEWLRDAAIPAESAVGQVLEVTGVAVDTAGQRGESTIRRIRIVSSETLRQTLADLERAALEPLRQAAREQTVAAEQTEAARTRMLGDDQQRAEAEDRLRAAEAAQSSAASRVAEGPESVIARLRAAVQIAQDNGLAAESLKSLLGGLETAVEEHLAPAGSGLEQTWKQLAENQPEAAASTADQTIADQRRAAERLDALVESLRRDDARRSALEDLAQIQDTQTRLSEASRQVSGAADARAEASRLAQQQRELARESEAIAARLERLAQQLREQDPALAAAATEAAEQLTQGSAASTEQFSVAEAMRAAAAELERGREGRAAQLQTQAAEQLSATRRTLSGEDRPSEDREADSDSTARGFASGVDSLRDEQAALVNSLRETVEPRLAAAQQELADRAAALAESTAAPPGYPEAIADAAAAMERASALLRRPGSAAAGIESSESALRRLQIIAESLAGPEDAPAEQAADEAAEQGGEDAASGAPPVPLATLRLVRSTQEFLRSRTQQIAAAEQEVSEDDSVDPLRRAEIQAAKRALAEEQQRLVERIERYAQSIAEAESQEEEDPHVPVEN